MYSATCQTTQSQRSQNAWNVSKHEIHHLTCRHTWFTEIKFETTTYLLLCDLNNHGRNNNVKLCHKRIIQQPISFRGVYQSLALARDARDARGTGNVKQNGGLPYNSFTIGD